MSKIEAALKKARDLQGQNARPLPDYDEQLPARYEEIGRMREPRIRTKDELAELKVLHPGMRARRVMDAFRSLRTNIVRAIPQGNPVIVVSGATPEGGSSFVAANLASSIALGETQTALLMDCNIENPGLGHLSLEGHGAGLVDFLRDPQVKVERIIHATGIPRLRLIPVGTGADGGREYFSLPRFKSLLSELKQRYPDRHIILDAPAASVSADAGVLSDLSDCSLLVLSYARNTDDQVENAIHRLGPEKVLGMVINDEPTSPVTGW